MNSHSPAPSSGHGRTESKTDVRSRGLPFMSERQTEAYLLARDAVRRIQRTSSLLGAVSQRAAGGIIRAQDNRPQSH
jgi:hypothetical protein